MINIAGDWLGLGQLAGVQKCGGKPMCISFAKNSVCAERKEKYDACVKKVQQETQITEQKDKVFKKNLIIAIVVGVSLILGIILYFKLRKK